MAPFNPRMMEIGREARGMTQAELSARMQIGQGTVSRYESGQLTPPDDFLPRLGEALGFPPAFFREPIRVAGFPPFHYRRRRALPARTAARINAEMNIRRLHVEKLSRACDPPRRSRILEVDPDEFRGPISDVARLQRETWMLPRGPVDNLTEAIEAAGGIVIACDFGTDQIDALSQRLDGLPVMFFVNQRAPADRMRHTLAHELGHMVLHSVLPADDERMEDEADEFAGCFLLPEDEVRHQFRRFTLPQLANMKQLWRVSIAALAMRADRLGQLTPHQKKTFWIEYNKLGYRRREPVELPPERPGLLRRMIDFHLRDLGYGVPELAAMLCLLPEEFAALYLDRPRLRLVG